MWAELISILRGNNELDEYRLQQEVVKILMRAAVFTGLLMGIIFLLQYEVEDSRPTPSVAIFTFAMAFIFTILVWLFKIYITNTRLLNYVSTRINTKFEPILRGVLSLIASAFLMWIWASLDVFFNMECRDQPNIFGLMQVRGVVIVAISITMTWGIEQALAQQRALNIISKLKEENFEARFEVLKQQINPHFLFNSLNILKGMIRTQHENAEDYVVKLSEVYRYILQSNTQDLVLVSEELNILNSYFFMLKSRFRDAIDLQIKLQDKVLKSSIPPLTLQILVENCVKHNIISQSKPLYITIYEENGFIIVKNNLQVKNALASSNKVGLNNIIQRYFHARKQDVLIEKTPQFFIVKLPIML